MGPTHRARPVSAAPAAPAATSSVLQPPHPTPRPPLGRRPPTSAAPTRSRTARGRSRRSPGGAPARRRPPARPRLPSPARNGRPAAHSARLPMAPAAQSLPPAHLPPALPHASDWVPVGRRRTGPAAQLQHGLGWVGRAQICVWSVPAGACGLPPEAAALFLSLSAASLPFSVVAAPPVEAADGLSRPGVAELGWVGLDGSGRRWLGRKGEREMGEERHRRSRRRRRNDETASRFRRLVGGLGRCKRGSRGFWWCPSRILCSRRALNKLVLPHLRSEQTYGRILQRANAKGRGSDPATRIRT